MPGPQIDLAELSQMRAVMHPARWRVLQELYSGESLTATQAGALVGLTPSAMSYHLNQLGRLGLIARDDSPDGRERPWRAAASGWGMSAQPDAAVGAVMMRNLLAAVAAAVGQPPPEDPGARPWPASYIQVGLHLDRDAARQLYERVREVVAEFESAEPGPIEYEGFWILAATSSDPPSRPPSVVG